MILIKPFWEFIKIGAFSFGGGYAMIPLIQNDIVETINLAREFLL